MLFRVSQTSVNICSSDLNFVSLCRPTEKKQDMFEKQGGKASTVPEFT